jgi:hypothetical protein
MKKEEFIAVTSARWGFAERGDEKGTADIIQQAQALAVALEKRNLAPWLIPTEQRELINELPKIVKVLMAEMNGPNLPRSYADSSGAVLSVALINVAAPSSVAKIMSDLSKNLPPTAAIPAGEWEICFRPALIDKSGLIMPGAVQGKPN